MHRPPALYLSPDDAHSIRFQFIDLGCGTVKDRNVLPKPEGGRVTRCAPHPAAGKVRALCSGSPGGSALQGEDFRRPGWVFNPENLSPPPHSALVMPALPHLPGSWDFILVGGEALGGNPGGGAFPPYRPLPRPRFILNRGCKGKIRTSETNAGPLTRAFHRPPPPSPPQTDGWARTPARQFATAASTQLSDRGPQCRIK